MKFSGFLGLRIVLPLVAIFCLGGARLAAESPAAETDARKADSAFIDSFREYQQTAARAEFLRQETLRLETGPPAMPPVFKTLADSNDAEGAAALVELLHTNNQPVQAALEKAAGEIGDNEEKLHNSWSAIHDQLSAKETALFEGQADQRIACQIAFLMNVDNRWFWLFGLVALATLAGIVLYDRRHEVRRQLNGGKARAMGLARIINILLVLLTLVTLAVFFSGNRIYQSLLTIGSGNAMSPERESEAKQQALVKNLAEARKAEQDARMRCDAARKASYAWLAKLSSPDPKKDLLALRTSTRESLEAIVVGLKVQDALAKQLKTDTDDLVKVWGELGENSKELERNYEKRHWIRRGLGVGLLGLVAVGGGVSDSVAAGLASWQPQTFGAPPAPQVWGGAHAPQFT